MKHTAVTKRGRTPCRRPSAGGYHMEDGGRQAILEQLESARRLLIVLQSPDWATLPQLALDSGLTVHDAAYLSLAQSLRVPLATFDRRLGDVASRA